MSLPSELVQMRKPVRASFTKACNELATELNNDDPHDLQVKILITKIERLSSQLSIYDDKIRDSLFVNNKGDDYEDEYASVEKYKDNYDLILLEVEKYKEKFKSCPHRESDSVSVASDSKGRNLKLPTIKLRQFGGEIKDWLGFWNQFRRIDEDNGIEPEDKFQYLVEATIPGSRAREIVETFPATSENYGKVITCFKTRFGRKDLLIEFYIRELLNMVINNVKQTGNKVNITKLYDQLESHLRALESIGTTKDKYAAILFPLVESSLPEDVIRAWWRSALSKVGNHDEETYKVKLENLFSFLESEAAGEQRINLAMTGFTATGDNKQRTYQKVKRQEDEAIPTASHLFSGEKYGKPKGNTTCIFCGKSHDSKDCFVAQKMSFKEKTFLLNKHKACNLCMKAGHRAKFCRIPVRCIVCGGKHCSLMCPELPVNKSGQEEKECHVENEGKEAVVSANHCCSGEILLQTLMVKIINNGHCKTIRAVIDTGSQRSYILTKVAYELGIQSSGKEDLTQVLFGGSVSKRSSHKKYSVTLTDLRSTTSRNIVVLDQPVICGVVPRLNPGGVTEDLRQIGIIITDVGHKPTDIELLIGADSASEIFTGNQHKLSCGLLAVETVLGWVVMGKVPRLSGSANSCASMAISMLTHTDKLADLWSLEAIGVTDPAESKNRQEKEEAALKHFKETVVRNYEGRYEVCLPWLDNKLELTDNKVVAEKRLYTMTNKLLLQNKYDDYENAFNEWLNEGIIETVPEDELNDPGHYLPHRGIFKATSSTKVRPVFDASSKSKGSLSLNDCLEKGPNFLELIPALLIRFRLEEVGVISDIRKAFLQISVAQRDRNYLRFLWWDDPTRKTMKVMRHCRVVFGLNCSPFLLAAVLSHHIDTDNSEYEEAAIKLKKSFYVDNCVTSVRTEAELEDFRDKSTGLLDEAKFDLRAWESSILSEKEETYLSPSAVLGLLWDRFNDLLFCRVDNVPVVEDKITRRNMLSTCCSIFDPIGFSSPFTLIPKILLQETWKEKISWDAEVSDELQRLFLKWLNDLPKLGELKIPRCVMYFTGGGVYSLHIFCDASKNAYAAVVFLRREYGGMVEVNLLLAKARVAPLKSLSMTRLELMGCCIGSRLTRAVKEAISCDDIPTSYWTDSTTALTWIRNNENVDVFVRNRVKEIRQLSDENAWRYVPGELNPADLPSRGSSVDFLLESRWWEGPSWLKGPESSWPSSKFESVEYEVQNSIRKTFISNLICNDYSWYLRYFSSYNKIKRLIAWIFRFKFNIRTNCDFRKRGELSVDELDSAERFLVRTVQEESFKENREDLLKPICVCIDNEGILRVKTKITSREDEENFKYPTVLPGNHELVKRLILEEHARMGHTGAQTLLNKLRERFWIVKGRRSVRAAIASCGRCKRYQTQRMQPLPAVLPEDRVRDALVFEVVGVDLAGPLILRGGEKSWIVLYTCAVYRAVHLELVTTLSTNGFLQSLRRFIARRGRPKIIYSDNGTNFVGAFNLFKEIDWAEIENETASQRIQWKFNPPTAAWWGGWWERLIRILKNILKRVLGRASLKYEELTTALYECEALVNQRPLTYLSEDVEDMAPLTPSVFLQDIPSVGVPDLDHLDNVNLTKRYQFLQRLKEELRRRFRVEYLGQLLIHHKRQKGERKLEVGDVVLIENENTKRTFWPLAKVVNIFPSRDGEVRVVRLKTTNGEIVRPLQRLFPLEAARGEHKQDPEEESKPEDHSSAAGEIRATVTRSGRRVRLPSRFFD